MAEIRSKSQLAVVLSRLEGFKQPKVRQEQYMTDSETAASVLWNASLLGDIGGKVIVDLGCGTSILGIGALLLGAKKTVFIDNDQKSLDIGKNNLSIVRSEGYTLGKAEFALEDVANTKNRQADIVVQNPPFGTKTKHIDRLFLEKAIEIAPIAYSFHKSETSAFLTAFMAGKSAKLTHKWDFRYPLKATYSFHRRRMHHIAVSCLRFQRF